MSADRDTQKNSRTNTSETVSGSLSPSFPIRAPNPPSALMSSPVTMTVGITARSTPRKTHSASFALLLPFLLRHIAKKIA